uniref:TLE_N domain-containing protein n=1 Tax=Panagrellus redivivus TaxID=6233 RepID=A0A7E4UPI5_PANRE
MYTQNLRSVSPSESSGVVSSHFPSRSSLAYSLTILSVRDRLHRLRRYFFRLQIEVSSFITAKLFANPFDIIAPSNSKSATVAPPTANPFDLVDPASFFKLQQQFFGQQFPLPFGLPPDRATTPASAANSLANLERLTQTPFGVPNSTSTPLPGKGVPPNRKGSGFPSTPTTSNNTPAQQQPLVASGSDGRRSAATGPGNNSGPGGNANRMYQNRNNPNHGPQKYKQLYDAACDDWNQLSAQVNSLRHELDKVRAENEQHLRSQATVSESFYTLNLEVMRYTEITKRLTAAVNQFVPMLPHEHQAGAIAVVERAKNVTQQDIMMLQQQQQLGMLPGMFNGFGGPAGPFPPMMAAAFSGMKPEELAMIAKHPGMMMPPGMNAMMAMAAGQMPSVSAPGPPAGGHPGMGIEDVANRLSNRSGSGTPMKKPKLDPDADQNLEIDVQGDDAPATGSATNGVKKDGRESAQSHTSSRDSATPKSRNANPLGGMNFQGPADMTNFLAQMVNSGNRSGAAPAIDPRLLFNSPTNGKPAYSYHCRDGEQPRPFDFPDNALTESGLPKGLKKVFDLPQGEVVCAVTFAPTNDSVYTGGKGCVKLWDITSAEKAAAPISSLNVLTDQYIRSCKLFPEDSWILVGGEASKIVVYDVSRESTVAEFDTGSQACYALAVAPDSNMCFSCCADGKVMLWDVRMKQKIKALTGHTEGASCIDLSPDGNTFWTGGLDSTVRSWDIREQKEISKHSFENQVFSLGVSPTSPWVAVGCENTQVEVFNTNENEKYILHSHESCVLSLKFSKTGKYFVTTGKDNFVNVSRTPYGARLVRLTENASVLSCDISSDDKYLVTGSGEKKANVYKIEFND